MRRRLQTQVLTIKLPSPGGGQRLKRLGGPGFDFTNVIDKVTARNLVNVNGTKYCEGLHIIWGVIQSLMKTATNQIWITNSINQWQWQWEKNLCWSGMSQDEAVDWACSRGCKGWSARLWGDANNGYVPWGTGEQWCGGWCDPPTCHLVSVRPCHLVEVDGKHNKLGRTTMSLINLVKGWSD